MMNKVWIIARKDIKELFRSKFYLYLLLLVIICFPYVDGASNVVSDAQKQGLSLSDLRTSAQSMSGIIAYTLPLVLSMLMCSVFAGYSIVVDKTKRILEPLLATPLSLRQIWIGKSLAVALPGIIIGICMSFLVLVAINVFITMPAVGGFTMPEILAIACALIVSPLLVMLVVLVVSFLQYITSNPRIPSLVFTAVFIGIYMSTIMEQATSWNFSLIYLVGLVFLSILLAFLFRYLTKERAILSSKG